MEKGGKVDGVVEQVPGLPHHEHTKIGYFDEGDQEFKNVRHPSMDLKSETENRKLACARVLIKARYENENKQWATTPPRRFRCNTLWTAIIEVSSWCGSASP